MVNIYFSNRIWVQSYEYFFTYTSIFQYLFFNNLLQSINQYFTKVFNNHKKVKNTYMNNKKMQNVPFFFVFLLRIRDFFCTFAHQIKIR